MASQPRKFRIANPSFPGSIPGAASSSRPLAESAKGTPRAMTPPDDLAFHDVVQVAGVLDQAEADLIVECGVDLVGFPFRLSVHREDLSEAAAAAIIRRLPRTTRAVLITYLADADEIRGLAEFLGVVAVQVHG